MGMHTKPRRIEVRKNLFSRFKEHIQFVILKKNKTLGVCNVKITPYTSPPPPKKHTKPQEKRLKSILLGELLYHLSNSEYVR